MSQTLLVGLLLAGAIVAMAVLTWVNFRQSRRRNRRFASFANRGRTIAVLPGKGMGSATLALDSRGSGTETNLEKWLPGAGRLRDMLARTGRPIALTTYAGWTLGLVAAVFLVLLRVTHGGIVLSLAAAGAAGFVIPQLVVRRMGNRRLAAFTAQFPDAIDLIVRALRAGLPLSEALITISHECADPVGAEFRKVVGALAISRSIEESLWEIERTIDSAELRFFIISISTQMQSGGNLGETLGNLSTILRQRSQMRMKVKAMTGEARASATVLGSLPFVIGLLMTFTNPGYIAPLFTDPRGWVMLGGGAIMLSIGVGIMVKLVSFEI